MGQVVQCDWLQCDKRLPKSKDGWHCHKKVFYPEKSGFASDPDRLLLVEYLQLLESRKLDRVGSPKGKYLCEISDGTVASFGERALLPNSIYLQYYQYELTGNTLPDLYVKRGVVAPWQGAKGGATQVVFCDSRDQLMTVESLIEAQGVNDPVGLDE